MKAKDTAVFADSAKKSPVDSHNVSTTEDNKLCVSDQRDQVNRDEIHIACLVLEAESNMFYYL
jgi:hypothetical protein